MIVDLRNAELTMRVFERCMYAACTVIKVCELSGGIVHELFDNLKVMMTSWIRFPRLCVQVLVRAWWNRAMHSDVILPAGPCGLEMRVAFIVNLYFVGLLVVVMLRETAQDDLGSRHELPLS